MKRILITVTSGVAEVDQSTIPEGIEVEVRDYDIQGIKDIKEDNCGDLYNETLWTRIE